MWPARSQAEGRCRSSTLSCSIFRPRSGRRPRCPPRSSKPSRPSSACVPAPFHSLARHARRYRSPGSLTRTLAQDKFEHLFGTRTMSRQNLMGLISVATVLKISPGDAEVPLYASGQRSSKFAMVLDGSVRVLAGQEGFACSKGPWDVFCRNVLETRAPVHRRRPAATGNTRCCEGAVCCPGSSHVPADAERGGAGTRHGVSGGARLQRDDRAREAWTSADV